MPEEKDTPLKLRFVKWITPTDDGAKVEFVDGSVGKLAQGDKQYNLFLMILMKGMQGQQPVGSIVARTGEINLIDYADADTPRSLTDDAANKRIKIWFTGHDGTNFLYRDHPEFDKLYKLLSDMARDKVRVWYAARLPDLRVEDALPYADVNKDK